MKSYSQYYQDFFIDFLFSGKKNGVFLDIGANDGITFSNSFLFEKKRDWSGLCVEPQIDIFNECTKHRNCFLENCCIDNEERNVIFRKVLGENMLSGILDYMDADSRKRIDDCVSNSNCGYEDINIQAYNINTLLEKYKMYTIDFCSIDVEGAELEILKSLDFGKYTVHSFAVEGNNEKITLFLKSKGYKCIISENDNFYVKSDQERLSLFALLVRLYKLHWKIRRRILIN